MVMLGFWGCSLWGKLAEEILDSRQDGSAGNERDNPSLIPGTLVVGEN